MASYSSESQSPGPLSVEAQRLIEGLRVFANQEVVDWEDRNADRYWEARRFKAEIDITLTAAKEELASLREERDNLKVAKNVLDYDKSCLHEDVRAAEASLQEMREALEQIVSISQYVNTLSRWLDAFEIARQALALSASSKKGSQ